MTPWPTKHLTADDLDAFHTEALSSEMRMHFESCEDCRRLAALDREVVVMLQQVPSFSPRAGFSDRVMARVQIATPVPVPVLSFPRLTRRRIAALTSLAAGLVLSVAWSSANRTLLEAWLQGAESVLLKSATALWQQAFAAMTSAAWFEPIRQLSDTPIRLAAGAALVVGSYAAGLLALRRLATPSAASSSNVGA